MVGAGRLGGYGQSWQTWVKRMDFRTGQCGPRCDWMNEMVSAPHSALKEALCRKSRHCPTFEACERWMCVLGPCLPQVLHQQECAPAFPFYLLWTWVGLFLLHPFHTVINIFFNVQLQWILNKLFCNTLKSLCKLFVNTFKRPQAIKYYFIISPMLDIWCSTSVSEIVNK